MGAIFFENFYYFNSSEQFLSFAKENNIELLIADMSGENLFLTKKPKNKFAIVIGNEGNGVSKVFLQSNSKVVSIPMKNNLESLNAGVASAIFMYYFDNI